jgi:hypothetical protein
MDFKIFLFLIAATSLETLGDAIVRMVRALPSRRYRVEPFSGARCMVQRQVKRWSGRHADSARRVPMTKKKPPLDEPKDIKHRTDGSDWTLTIFLEQRRSPIGWVARDAAWPLATQVIEETLNRLPSNARVYLDCRFPDSMTFRREK